MIAEKRVTISRSNFFRLCEEIRNSVEWIMGDRPTFTQGAKRFAETLGFPINPEHVRQAAELVGVKWDSPNKKLKGAAAISELAAKVDELTKTVDALQVLIHELYGQLGGVYPNGYRPAAAMPSVLGR